jgi:hypothetical protein
MLPWSVPARRHSRRRSSPWPTRRPPDASVFGGKVTEAAWKAIPSWGLVANRDNAIGPDGRQFMVKRVRVYAIEVKSSRAGPVSRSGAVTRPVERARLTV